MSELGKIEPKVTHRKCPGCGFIVTQKFAVQYTNVLCPECREHRIDKFTPLKEVQE